MQYLISVVGLLGVDTDYANWTSGYFSVLAGKLGSYLAYAHLPYVCLGGKYLEDVVIVAAMIGNVGIYNSLLLPAAEQLQALCGEEFLNIPFMQWKHPKYVAFCLS